MCKFVQVLPASLQIICLDDPSYPTYGGVIDIHYRIKSLHQAGLRLNLEVFTRDRHPNPSILLNWATSVNYYLRKPMLSGGLQSNPYMIYSRSHPDLLKSLKEQNCPVWFEGLHTTSSIQYLKRFYPNKKLYLRSHNIESHYYHELFIKEKNPFRKAYFKAEFIRLRKYEQQVLPLFDAIYCISTEDTQHIKHLNPNTYWLPAYVKYNTPKNNPLSSISEGKLKLLYHGNFNVLENRLAAKWLLSALKNFSKPFELTLAGKQLSKAKLFIPSGMTVKQISDPGVMEPLLAEADIVLLPGSQRSGVKIKLLESLAAGKRILCSPETVVGSGLEAEALCFISAPSLLEKLNLLCSGELDGAMLAWLDKFEEIYNPEINTQKLLIESWGIKIK
jgi:hypothetical protein